MLTTSLNLYEEVSQEFQQRKSSRQWEVKYRNISKADPAAYFQARKPRVSHAVVGPGVSEDGNSSLAPKKRQPATQQPERYPPRLVLVRQLQPFLLLIP